ncbi:hypothetical protein, partial [Streptomyces decoyicus]|uniref:hypothetical protein n=1 Tax=Streptomyces decoyicus TaxID=249567 RepID=UPI0033B8F9C3
QRVMDLPAGDGDGQDRVAEAHGRTAGASHSGRPGTPAEARPFIRTIIQVAEERSVTAVGNAQCCDARLIVR